MHVSQTQTSGKNVAVTGFEEHLGQNPIPHDMPKHQVAPSFQQGGMGSEIVLECQRQKLHGYTYAFTSSGMGFSLCP